MMTLIGTLAVGLAALQLSAEKPAMAGEVERFSRSGVGMSHLAEVYAADRFGSLRTDPCVLLEGDLVEQPLFGPYSAGGFQELVCLEQLEVLAPELFERLTLNALPIQQAVGDFPRRTRPMRVRTTKTPGPGVQEPRPVSPVRRTTTP